MNGRRSFITWLPAWVALLLLILHFAGVIMTPVPETPNPEISSKRFDRVTLYNLSMTTDIQKATLNLYRRDEPAEIWRTYEFDVARGTMNGRVLNLVSGDTVEDIVRVTCSFATDDEKEHSAEIMAEAAVQPESDPGAPALNSATFWFGPDGPGALPDGTVLEGGEDQLCGEGVLGDHTTWVDYRP